MTRLEILQELQRIVSSLSETYDEADDYYYACCDKAEAAKALLDRIRREGINA
jgi:hypothetical protein